MCEFATDLVVEFVLDLSGVDDVLDARDGQRRLGHVGGHHAQPVTVVGV